MRQPDRHHFCVACGRALPGYLLAEGSPKVTDLFLGFPAHPSDPPDPLLRVSRYLEDQEFSTPDGETRLVAQHVRFSIWIVDRPVCAMSLGDEEARRLGWFLLADIADAREATNEGVALPGA